ncbi:MAG: type II CRISPR RNA-guided endonuclease Cas9 [Cycloclasticus sp.]|nr:type II CRISPR RNA-guided endonuclease Cas9 [Cycloclasticus sp.]MBG95570.1 type II CRISPR RNA-guided endonuclease Cas9 [Cycloclasticus sp.]
MGKKILGLDLGSNSIGWALLEEVNGEANSIIDIGSRIFTKAVEEKVPTPKNVKRRDMRLGRRVLQRRARRKQRMLNYLVSLDLLSNELLRNHQPEIILNELGDPYELRSKALDEKLTRYELGRVLLHFVARRGFLSTKKQVAGDLIDDPDTIAYLNEIEDKPTQDKEEGAFKADISEVRKAITLSGARTLGEYLHQLDKGVCKRNRSHEGGHLRTDRAMYKDELDLIWQQQQQFFSDLPADFMEDNKGVKEIIFYQRPLKLKKDRIGKCSLEPKNNRASMARLEVQRFRYLQDVNNLQYFERQTDQWLAFTQADRQKLIEYFEQHPKITITALKKLLGLDKLTKINLEAKNLKGNITACEIRNVLKDRWDNYSDKEQFNLVEDLLSIKKKSALKTRLIKHWGLGAEVAIKLCLLEFEPSHSNLSLKAINKLLPFLQQGLIYSKKDQQTGELGALQAAGYSDEIKEQEVSNKLGAPLETSNPIVNKAMHELKRVVNALIKEYGKPDIIRIEMARDLEMNTKRYKENEARQNKNKKANEGAVEAYKGLNLGKYPSYDDKIKYRLWEEQNRRCAYSNEMIPLHSVFTSSVEIDHILPFKKSLDDSYMNKVLCYVAENRNKGDRTPKDAWSGNVEKWMQITQAISKWKGVDSKVKRFHQTEADLQKRDFISSQLNDTRYISKLALDYMAELVGNSNVSVTKGSVVSQIRHQWGFNDLIGEVEKKDRTDHRHHAIDAVVIAATSRSLYTKAVKQIERDKLKIEPPYPNIRNELAERLEQMIVSHASNRKLSGALHEETGAGYIEKHGGLVYRKNLTPDFTVKNAKQIVDDTIKLIVLNHLEQYDNDPKKAFADNIKVMHKDGKTPIKRVRVLQSNTTLKKLEQNKVSIKDKSGKVFKYMSYGNMHHVEIIQNIETGKYKGEFVTMMQASHRAKGIQSKLNPEGKKLPLVKVDHGDEWQFIMALHINDLVSVSVDGGGRIYYRVQKLEVPSGLTLRLNTSSTIENKIEGIRKSITALMRNGLKKHFINAIGVCADDKTNH